MTSSSQAQMTSLGLLRGSVADEGPLPLQLGAHSGYHLLENSSVPEEQRSGSGEETSIMICDKAK